MNAHLNENPFFHNVLSKYARHNMKMHFGCVLVQICNFCDRVKLTITFSLSSTITEFGGLCVSCFRCQETVETRCEAELCWKMWQTVSCGHLSNFMGENTILIATGELLHSVARVMQMHFFSKEADYIHYTVDFD